jgi:hypothetical protein
MPTPFPGMDPYLERPGLWEEIHTQLIVDCARVLRAQIPARYRVAIEQRTYLGVVDWGRRSGAPDMTVSEREARSLREAALAYQTTPQVVVVPLDEEVVERHLEIVDLDNQAVVTAIEILSPTNKLSAAGRRQYLRKRRRLLNSQTHFVEVDLLRAGSPLEFASPPQDVGDYRILVSRAHERPLAHLYAFAVRAPIPSFPVPLRPGETEPAVDLNRVLHTLYDLLDYGQVVDYQGDPDPPLAGDDARWADALLRSKGLRT